MNNLPMNPRQQLNQHLAANQIDNAFILLVKQVQRSSPFFTDVLIHSAQWNDLSQQQRRGVISEDNRRLETNKLLQSLIELGKNLPQEDWIHESNPEQHDAVPILAICKDMHDLREMHDYFARLPIVDISYAVQEAYDPPPAGTRLLLFANHQIGTVEKGRVSYNDEEQKRLTLMQTYLEHTNLYGVHYGKFWDQMDSLRDRLHAANSRFALFARVKEAVEYVRYFRDEGL